jgi:hypothetical protein
MTSIDDLAGPTPRSIPRFTGVEPINLPNFTFLIGDPMNCFMFAEELSKQSSFVYTEDFHTPIYDAVQALHELPALTTYYDIVVKYENDVNAIRNAVNVNLVERLIKRTEELLSAHPYQIVVRDLKGFSINGIPQFKDCVLINLDNQRLYRGATMQQSLILPPGADMMKELRTFLD